MGTMSAPSSSKQEDEGPDTKFRAFYLGPRGTYSHSVARAIFHAARPSGPPTRGVPSSSASHSDGQSSSNPAAGSIVKANQVQLVPCTTITKTLEAALQEAQHDSGATSGSNLQCAYAVLPIENSTFGPVHETLDVLRRAGISIGTTAPHSAAFGDEEKLSILGEYRLAVAHTLLAGPRTKQRLRQLSKRNIPSHDGARDSSSRTDTAANGCSANGQAGVGNGQTTTPNAADEDELDLGDLIPLNEVLSHEQALGQCADFLKAYAPQAKPISVASTALAAEKALHHDYQPSMGDDESASDHSLIAAVGSELCSEVYGLSILRRNVEDRDDNTTRFVVIRVEIAPKDGAGETRPDLNGVLRPFEGVPVYSRPTA
ncbi:hypothetical protein OC845_002494 [Tilletia horrida]|nr:hypothetical protein OC845_002494 [Tilletia horrida]